ncbi:MAG TPA: formate dehydrogenase subunit gamma [Usitatibacter sp.]|nr:formate dehydrogenase subunit gamma [Usitatibacter sp.]
MSRSTARSLGALILGAALSSPLALLAQQPAAKAAAPAPAAAAPAAAPTPPVPAKDSTAVPGWNKPPEQWDIPSEKPQYASIPGREKNVLIQAEGREWREFRNGPVTNYGGWLIGIAFLAVMGFYFVKGTLPVHGAPTGKMIERFNAVERASHWTMALSFVILGLTGATILWGKYLILPWLGYSGFSVIQTIGKNIHNFIGPLFIFSLLTTFLLYLKDNFFTHWDIQWFTSLGGWLKEVPSYKFNAGEKMVFWGGLVFLGAIISATGLILDFPNWNQTRAFMQQANVIHAVAAILFISVIIGHAYMGTLGLAGAYQSMRVGTVDETWAKEHHALWYEDVKAGKRPEHFVASATQPATGD